MTIAGVLATVLARCAIGPLCDKCGPRATYTALLAFGSLPAFAIAFAWDYNSFLVCRLIAIDPGLAERAIRRPFSFPRRQDARR